MNELNKFAEVKLSLIAAAQRLIDAALESSELSVRKKNDFKRALKLLETWPAIAAGTQVIIGVEALNEGDNFDEMDAIEFIINDRSLTILSGGFVADHYVGSQPIVEPELVVDIDGNQENFDLLPIRLNLLEMILRRKPTFYLKQKKKKVR
jgi:hypothetical protein